MVAHSCATCAVLFLATLARAAAGEPSCGPEEVCGPQDVEAVEEASVDALRVELLQSSGRLLPAGSSPRQEGPETGSGPAEDEPVRLAARAADDSQPRAAVEGGSPNGGVIEGCRKGAPKGPFRAPERAKRGPKGAPFRAPFYIPH